jgi:RES domain-containing protein
LSLPPTSAIRQSDTHRLIPAKYRPASESVLARIADDDAHLQDLFRLDDATNDRLLAEADLGLLPGIGADELVFRVPRYRIVNAAFCHAHPLGSRFNGPDRGAWYAAFEIATALAEVVHHKTVALAEIDCFEDSATCDDYLADFAGAFHDLRSAPAFADCLAAASYVASQALAERLLDAGALGVVYPSVRRAGGTNLACFRPALVTNVRLDATYRMTWAGAPEPEIAVEAPARA